MPQQRMSFYYMSISLTLINRKNSRLEKAQILIVTLTIPKQTRLLIVMTVISKTLMILIPNPQALLLMIIDLIRIQSPASWATQIQIQLPTTAIIQTTVSTQILLIFDMQIPIAMGYLLPWVKNLFRRKRSRVANIYQI